MSLMGSSERAVMVRPVFSEEERWEQRGEQRGELAGFRAGPRHPAEADPEGAGLPIRDHGQVEFRLQEVASVEAQQEARAA